jgi:hypothetical protein
VTNRDERIETYYHQSAWDLAEKVVDLEDETERLKNLNAAIAKAFPKSPTGVKTELDPSRLESTLRMYVAELDYDIHKSIECGEQDRLDHYPEEADFFLRCWDAAGES